MSERPLMLEKDLRRAILCDRKAEIVETVLGYELLADCPGDCISHLLGWHGIYLTPLQDSRHRWRTPARGDWGPGWPDLQLVNMKQRRVVYAELKRKAGIKPDPAQAIVIDGLRAAGQEVYLWTPELLDAGEIWRTLQARA